MRICVCSGGGVVCGWVRRGVWVGWMWARAGALGSRGSQAEQACSNTHKPVPRCVRMAAHTPRTPLLPPPSLHMQGATSAIPHHAVYSSNTRWPWHCTNGPPPLHPACASLDVAALDQLLPAEAGLVAVGQHDDVPLLDQQRLVLHDEQRPAAPPVVGVQPQLLQRRGGGSIGMGTCGYGVVRRWVWWCASGGRG